jgi:adenylate cyclase
MLTSSRQLACIVFTDIVGYSALMGRDEQKAFDILVKNRELQKPIVEANGGRLLKEMGDGMMASFTTATDAVNAAVQIQEKLQTDNLFQLRIGIHLGEVVFENQDVFGDGVNIASRIQSVAVPGSIYISEAVATNVINKRGIQTRYVKEEKLKNIHAPIRIYEVVTNRSHEGSAQNETQGLPLPGNSIAVMPFVNMSNDIEQDYFCDGVSEEIINALGQLNRLRVIARTSTFSFKGKTIDLREIGKLLDVRTILEGSVRKAGKRLRINAQLISVSNGSRLWSNQYDRELEDVFAIQEDIATQVATSVQGYLTSEEKQVIRRQETIIEAYEYFLRGRQSFHRLMLPESVQQFQKAIEVDAEYAQAYAGLADAHSWIYEWEGQRETDLKQAEENSCKALSLAPNMAESHVSRGYVLALGKKYDAAEQEFNKAIELNSNSFDAYYLFGRSSFARGDIEKSAELFRKASEVRQEDYQSLLLLAQSLRMLGKDKDQSIARRSIERARKQLELNPKDSRALSLGSGTLFEIGEREEAFEWLNRAIEINPEDSSVLFNGACLYSKAGDINNALNLLERGFQRGSGNRSWMAQDPDYDSLRNEPRFKALLINS